jgi:hypothetical protein
MSFMSTTTAPPPTRTVVRPRVRHGIGFWAIAYAFLVVLAYNAVPAPLYGICQQRDGFSSFAITVIFAAYAVGVVISLFTVGHLSDWHGRRHRVRRVRRGRRRPTGARRTLHPLGNRHRDRNDGARDGRARRRGLPQLPLARAV